MNIGSQFDPLQVGIPHIVSFHKYWKGRDFLCPLSIQLSNFGCDLKV